MSTGKSGSVAAGAASWKTTAGGVLVGLVAVVSELFDMFGVVAEGYTDGVVSWERVVFGLAAMGLGWFARDADKSSQDSGVRP